MRIVLWATYAKPELIGRLKPILGDDLIVVADPEELAATIADAEGLLCPDFLYGAQTAETVRRRGKRLRWLQMLTQGFENAQAHGVPAGVTVTGLGNIYFEENWTTDILVSEGNLRSLVADEVGTSTYNNTFPGDADPFDRVERLINRGKAAGREFPFDPIFTQFLLRLEHYTFIIRAKRAKAHRRSATFPP